jgi:hypothetical protein
MNWYPDDVSKPGFFLDVVSMGIVREVHLQDNGPASLKQAAVEES